MWEIVFSLGRADSGEGETSMGKKSWHSESSVKALVCTLWLVSHVLIPRAFCSFRSGLGGIRQSAWAEQAVDTGMLLRTSYAGLSTVPKARMEQFKARQTLTFDSSFNLDLHLCFKFYCKAACVRSQ